MSTEHKSAIEALIEARKEMSHPAKNKEGKIGNSRYMYADLISIIDATLPPLLDHGLFITQVCVDATTSEGLILETALWWQGSAEKKPVMISHIGIPQMQDSKALGSAITYARKYAWSAMVAVSAMDDDDGDAADNDAGAVTPPVQQRAAARDHEISPAKPPSSEQDAMTPGDAARHIADAIYSRWPDEARKYGQRADLVLLVEKTMGDCPGLTAIDRYTKEDRAVVGKETISRMRVMLAERE